MLGRSSSAKKGMHVIWDEDNLKQNEEIQKEYSAVKINEPKTPYRPPLASDSLEDDMKPLQLDEAAEALAPERMTAFDYVMSNGGAAYNGATTSQQQPMAATTSNLSSEAGSDKHMEDFVGDKRSEPCTSFTSSGSEGSADKRRRFQQMRKQHYNMRDALLKAKQLLSEDEEDAGRRQPDHEDEHEEDEEDDTAGCQVGNGVAADPSSSRSRQQQHNASHEQHSSQHRQQQDGTASSSQQQKATDAVNS